METPRPRSSLDDVFSEGIPVFAGIKEIRPTIKHELRITYSINGLNLDPRELEAPRARRIFEKELIEIVPACPKCEGLNLAMKLKCPSCGDGRIEKITVVIHYNCNYVGGVGEFERNGEYVCPRCKRVLKNIGIDYGMPGEGFRCLKCGNVFSAPLIIHHCPSCDGEFKVNELSLKPVYAYRLLEKPLEMVTLEKIAELISHKGYQVSFLKSYVGVSDITHTFDGEIRKRDKSFVVKILTEETKVEDVLNFILCLIDTKQRGIAIALEGVDDTALKLIDTRIIPILRLGRQDIGKKLGALFEG